MTKRLSNYDLGLIGNWNTGGRVVKFKSDHGGNWDSIGPRPTDIKDRCSEVHEWEYIEDLVYLEIDLVELTVLSQTGVVTGVYRYITPKSVLVNFL